MVVTSLQIKNLVMKKLLSLLRRDYPDISFLPGNSFQWAHSTRTIHYDHTHENAPALLLHELAHACLNHTKFKFDVELVKKESQAWQYASQTLAPRYELSISEDTREDAIDSYRDWLHTRSLCPQCHTNSLQTKTGPYSCEACGCQWRANQARICELRRYRVKTTN